MLKLDLTGPSSFSSGVEPSWFGVAEKEVTLALFAYFLIVILKTFVLSVPKEPSIHRHTSMNAGYRNYQLMQKLIAVENRGLC